MWLGLLLLISGAIFAIYHLPALRHWYYVGLELRHVDGLAIVHSLKGPAYSVYVGYLNLATALGVLLLFRAWRQADPLYRLQALTLLVASLLPWSFHLLYQTGLSPHGMDLGPFGLAASGVAFSLAVLRHKVLRLLPLARDHVFDGIAEGVIVLDRHWRILDFNRAASDFFLVLVPARLGAEMSLLGHEANFTKALDSWTPFVLRLGLRRVEIRPSPLTDPQGHILGSTLMIQDVTERLELLEKLSQLASHDELTGCANRRALLERGEAEALRARRHKRPLSVLVFDVDDFKDINDQHGHQAGDEALRHIASVLRYRLRGSDMLGRYGGDEFVVVMPETAVHAAIVLAEELIDSCRAQCHIGLSMGVAELPLIGEEDFTTLLAHADMALYAAKRAGKGQVAAYPQPIAPQSLQVVA
ncbi:MAG: hypothetical protein CGU29_16360 [Candidatus Dactylopiibacterium carminicum]|uniref:diguanylate cyclase n=2 Tax=Candidatus Dactylopiibacterium carminicum TaxID=857335 RepID=A0A272EMW7_9RHOO|nr:hypothetical protein BGI27_16415 [Candidatus Dactylopiibacterium carminicum]PAS91453.1 MAG: hypothetical protein CGU29_16360 [Candidatus Dactylopiibacterium carminicum]PAS95789.1 MAG: hypothetical protein BSR46_16450 [Candidatus Dactylopiibacterium carminicum]